MISTDELAAILGQPNLHVLDCSVSVGRKDGDDLRINFLRSHIKGAKLIDLDYLKDMKSNLPYMMPTEAHFIDTMKRLNIKLTDKVVCYETGGMGLFSYRVAWMFEAMGHKDVHVLNGGF